MEGWLSDTEGELLYELAKKCSGRGVIVEIGSFKGKSTIWLAKGSKAGKSVKIYAIDPHQGYTEHDTSVSPNDTFIDFQSNIKSAQVDDLIVPIIQKSSDALEFVKEPIEFIFIDGSHEYEAVIDDYHNWIPKLLNNGVAAFHDTIGFLGPRKAINECVYLGKQFISIKLTDEITHAVKANRISFSDQIKNWKAYCIKRLCETAVLVKLPKLFRVWGKKVITWIQGNC